jgi:HEAT repeat protein
MKEYRPLKSIRSNDIRSCGSNFRFILLIFWFFLIFFGVIGCNESVQVPANSDSFCVEELEYKAIRIIRDSLADNNPRIRANAIEVSASTQQLQLMPKVQRLLKDDFVPVRFAAALAVGDTQYHLAKNILRELLSDPDENVRIATAYGLYKLGWPVGFELLSKSITHEDQDIRANAVMLLGKTGDSRALQFLYEAKDSVDSEHKVRIQAAEAIARLGDKRIYPKLWAALISYYADDRVIGIKAMGALGTKKGKNALLSMLDDDILEVRLAAAEQLGMLGYAEGEPEVLDVFEKKLILEMDRDSAERVKVLTALAIGRIGTPALTELLPGLLNDNSKFVRLTAAKAVLQCLKRG